jgi:hypothetical protein
VAALDGVAVSVTTSPPELAVEVAAAWVVAVVLGVVVLEVGADVAVVVEVVPFVFGADPPVVLDRACVVAEPGRDVVVAGGGEVELAGGRPARVDVVGPTDTFAPTPPQAAASSPMQAGHTGRLGGRSPITTHCLPPVDWRERVDLMELRSSGGWFPGHPGEEQIAFALSPRGRLPNRPPSAAISFRTTKPPRTR